MMTPERRAMLRDHSVEVVNAGRNWIALPPAELLALLDATDERDRLAGHAERMAAALDLVLHDAHPVFGSTAKWHGGIGGQMLTSHCSLTQGTPPGDEWAEYDMPSKPLREFVAEHPFDLNCAKAEMKQELLRALEATPDAPRADLTASEVESGPEDGGATRKDRP